MIQQEPLSPGPRRKHTLCMYAQGVCLHQAHLSSVAVEWPLGGSWWGTGPAWLNRPDVEEGMGNHRELGRHSEKTSIYKCMQMYANLCSFARSLAGSLSGSLDPTLGSTSLFGPLISSSYFSLPNTVITGMSIPPGLGSVRDGTQGFHEKVTLPTELYP